MKDLTTLKCKQVCTRSGIYEVREKVVNISFLL